MDFREALNVKAKEVEKPPLPPLGHYICKVSKQPEIGKVESDKGEWDTVTFPLRGLEATEDVDPELLAAFGSASALITRVQFMFPRGDDEEAEANRKRTLYNMKRFLVEHCGIPEGNKSNAQLMDESVNCKVLVQVRYRPDKNDPEIMYPEVGKTAPAEY